MASPQHQLEAKPTYVFLVEIIKYGIDQTSQLWRRLYFRAIYLPFVRFSFTHVNIPAMTDAEKIVETDESGKTVTTYKFCFREGIGVFDERDLADASCQGEFWPVTPLPFNSCNPAESVQNGQRFPKSSKPDRHNRQTFPIAPTPVRDLVQLQQGIEKLTKVAGA